MPVCIEDECNSELPPASLLFRAARQYAYGVLFSLAETHRRLERLALRKRAPLEGRCWNGAEQIHGANIGDRAIIVDCTYPHIFFCSPSPDTLSSV